MLCENRPKNLPNAIYPADHHNVKDPKKKKNKFYKQLNHWLSLSLGL